MPAQPLNRICYVEDDEDIQRIVRMSLERVGKMTVEVVSDPLVAIERMIAFKPDLVMLDWMMPGMDGPTLFRKMREIPRPRTCRWCSSRQKPRSASKANCRPSARRARS